MSGQRGQSRIDRLPVGWRYDIVTDDRGLCHESGPIVETWGEAWVGLMNAAVALSVDQWADDRDDLLETVTVVVSA